MKEGAYQMTRMARIVLVVSLSYFAIATALAQVKSSTITGTVTDPSGAVVTDATITVTNTDTNVSVTVKSNKAGDYTAPYLPEGPYTVTVQASGFRTYRATDIVLGTETALRVNATLTVGKLQESVEVKASTAELQTESATVEGAVDTNIIMDVPNITNNPLYYATLQAGVVPTAAQYSTTTLGVGFSDRQAYSGMRVNGGQVGNNDVQIDGLTVQGAAWHEATVLPNRDALQEVRVTTNDLPADIGGGQGSISLVTKSGTNQFHGDLNYRIRNEAFNANGLANDIQKVPRGKFRLNEGGGAVGGPVIIPHLFNGKDKMFFFVSFSRLSHAQPYNGFTNVPTDLQRQGDFGSTLIPNQSGNPIPVQIYDPYSAAPYNPTTVVRPEFPQSTNCDMSPGTPFQQAGRCGDMIPTPDAFGLKYLQAYPEPNHAPSDNFGDNNYYFSGTGSTVRDNLSARLDFHFGSKHAIYASGGLDNGSNAPFSQWGNKGPWYWLNGSSNFADDNPYASVGDTITLNSTTVIDVRYGVTRINATAALPAVSTFKPSDYTAYGMPATVQPFIALQGAAPSTGPWNLQCCGAALNNDGWNRKHEHQTNHTLTGSVTKILGKWTLRNGAEYRVYLGDWADLEYGTPALNPWGGDSYTEQYANLDGTGSSLNTLPQQNGYGGATFAVGAMGWDLDSGTTAKPALAAKYLAFFTQNDWKATRRLTINLGLRYEIQPGPTERYNHMSDVDLTIANPYASNGLVGLSASSLAGMGAIVFAGQPGYSRNLWDTQWNNLSPRVGAAYQLTDSTVVRGGYGRVYVPSNTGFNANGLIYGGAPFAGGVAPIPFGLTHTGMPVGHFEDSQNTELFLAPGAVQAPQLYGNVNASSSDDYFLRSGYKNGYMDQWNVTFEKRFRGWITSIGYVGSKGSDLGWRSFPINGEFNIPWSTLMSWQDQWIASSGTNDPGAVPVANPLPALIGGAHGDIGVAQISTMESMEPYLGLLGSTVYASNGTSKYNSLQIRAQHSYANGLSALFSYTWSRATGIAGGPYGTSYAESQIESQNGGSYNSPGGGVDFRNLGNNDGLLTYDTPQRFIAAITYALPFGKGKKFDPQNGVLRALVGGWELAPVVTLQSGQPWAPSCGSENGRCFPTGQPLELPKSYQHWYDGNTPVTLPDGRTFTPYQYTYLKWNPDAFGSQLVQWPDGTAHVAHYWLGTTPAYMGSLRMPWFQNVNLTVSRNFKFTERMNLQLLAEATNLFNRTSFLPGAVNNGYSSPILVADPSTNTQIGQNGNPAAGTLGLSLYDPRQLTLSLRLTF
jgi:trimeric autotransporter adhesin